MAQEKRGAVERRGLALRAESSDKVRQDRSRTTFTVPAGYSQTISAGIHSFLLYLLGRKLVRDTDAGHRGVLEPGMGNVNPARPKERTTSYHFPAGPTMLWRSEANRVACDPQRRHSSISRRELRDLANPTTNGNKAQYLVFTSVPGLQVGYASFGRLVVRNIGNLGAGARNQYTVWKLMVVENTLRIEKDTQYKRAGSTGHSLPPVRASVLQRSRTGLLWTTQSVVGNGVRSSRTDSNNYFHRLRQNILPPQLGTTSHKLGRLFWEVPCGHVFAAKLHISSLPVSANFQRNCNFTADLSLWDQLRIYFCSLPHSSRYKFLSLLSEGDHLRMLSAAWERECYKILFRQPHRTTATVSTPQYWKRRVKPFEGSIQGAWRNLQQQQLDLQESSELRPPSCREQHASSAAVGTIGLERGTENSSGSLLWGYATVPERDLERNRHDEVECVYANPPWPAFIGRNAPVPQYFWTMTGFVVSEGRERSTGPFERPEKQVGLTKWSDSTTSLLERQRCRWPGFGTWGLTKGRRVQRRQDVAGDKPKSEQTSQTPTSRGGDNFHILRSKLRKQSNRSTESEPASVTRTCRLVAMRSCRGSCFIGRTERRTRYQPQLTAGYPRGASKAQMAQCASEVASVEVAVVVAMEFINGFTMADVVRGVGANSISTREHGLYTSLLAREAVRAQKFVFGCNLINWDAKPSNMMVVTYPDLPASHRECELAEESRFLDGSRFLDRAARNVRVAVIDVGDAVPGPVFQFPTVARRNELPRRPAATSVDHQHCRVSSSHAAAQGAQRGDTMCRSNRSDCAPEPPGHPARRHSTSRGRCGYYHQHELSRQTLTGGGVGFSAASHATSSQFSVLESRIGWRVEAYKKQLARRRALFDERLAQLVCQDGARTYGSMRVSHADAGPAPVQIPSWRIWLSKVLLFLRRRRDASSVHRPLDKQSLTVAGPEVATFLPPLDQLRAMLRQNPSRHVICTSGYCSPECAVLICLLAATPSYANFRRLWYKDNSNLSNETVERLQRAVDGRLKYRWGRWLRGGWLRPILFDHGTDDKGRCCPMVRGAWSVTCRNEGLAASQKQKYQLLAPRGWQEEYQPELPVDNHSSRAIPDSRSGPRTTGTWSSRRQRVETFRGVVAPVYDFCREFARTSLHYDGLRLPVGRVTGSGKNQLPNTEWGVKFSEYSVVFSMGIMISMLFGGSGIAAASEDDPVHTMDGLCEWRDLDAVTLAAISGYPPVTMSRQFLDQSPVVANSLSNNTEFNSRGRGAQNQLKLCSRARRLSRRGLAVTSASTGLPASSSSSSFSTSSSRSRSSGSPWEEHGGSDSGPPLVSNLGGASRHLQKDVNTPRAGSFAAQHTGIREAIPPVTGCSSKAPTIQKCSREGRPRRAESVFPTIPGVTLNLRTGTFRWFRNHSAQGGAQDGAQPTMRHLLEQNGKFSSAAACTPICRNMRQSIRPGDEPTTIIGNESFVSCASLDRPKPHLTPAIQLQPLCMPTVSQTSTRRLLSSERVREAVLLTTGIRSESRFTVAAAASSARRQPWNISEQSNGAKPAASHQNAGYAKRSLRFGNKTREHRCGRSAFCNWNQAAVGRAPLECLTGEASSVASRSKKSNSLKTHERCLQMSMGLPKSKVIGHRHPKIHRGSKEPPAGNPALANCVGHNNPPPKHLDLQYRFTNIYSGKSNFGTANLLPTTGVFAEDPTLRQMMAVILAAPLRFVPGDRCDLSGLISLLTNLCLELLIDLSNEGYFRQASLKPECTAAAMTNSGISRHPGISRPCLRHRPRGKTAWGQHRTRREDECKDGCRIRKIYFSERRAGPTPIRRNPMASADDRTRLDNAARQVGSIY